MSTTAVEDQSNADLLEHPKVLDTARNAAWRVVRNEKYRGLVEFDDALQDAHVLVLTKQAPLVRRAIAGDGIGWGAVCDRLKDRLAGKYDTTARRASKAVSADVRYDDQAEGYAPPYSGPMLAQPVLTYTPELMAALVPSIWDWGYAWQLTIQNAPDAGMPRGTPNYSVGGTAWACFADAEIAWRRADTTEGERQAIFLVHGLDYTHEDAAALLGVHQSTVTRRLRRGMEKLTAKANALGPA